MAVRYLGTTQEASMDAVRVIVQSSRWAVRTDGLQWILSRLRVDGYWNDHCFVRTKRDTLGRCMRDEGVSPEVQRVLLAALPERFTM